MLKKAEVRMTSKEIIKLMGEEKMTFDNIVQRKLTWDNARKSLLIHSIIMGYPVPPLYAVKSEQGYDCLDGKQRANAIAEYINGGFKLTSLDEVTLDDGEAVDISNLPFAELAEELADRIKDYNFMIYYFENITQDEINEMFRRLNNGKPLTAIELTRVKAKSLAEIQELSRHEIFKVALSDKQIGGYKNEDIAIKSWIVMYNDNKSLDTKFVRPAVEDGEVTPEQKEEMVQVFSRIQEANLKLVEADKKKIAKKLFTMTHLISMTPIALQSIKDGLDIDTFTSFAETFFSPTNKTTISNIYNNHISAGANKKEAVEKRLKEVQKAYDLFVAKHLEKQEDSKNKDSKQNSEKNAENKAS